MTLGGSHVRRETLLEVDLIRETPEVAGPRGWAEGALVPCRAAQHGGDVLLTIAGETYLIKNEVLAALLRLGGHGE